MNARLSVRPLAVRRLLAVVLPAALAGSIGARSGDSLPARLTNQEFWTFIEQSSEPGGTFRSADITNLTSNEIWYQHVIPDLAARVPPGRAYLGVGPEQNFTYITATRPAMAVIVDIRRGNLDLQLMYKAVFELAADRADFVSILFAKPRPDGLGRSSSAHQIFTAFASVRASQALYDRHRAAIIDLLTKTRGLPLPQRDLDGIETIYRAFYANGYHLRTTPSYFDLMAATDAAGIERSFLATEEGFAWLKALQARNLVIPVVGDFAGSTALRTIGRYFRMHGATVGAFYLSNVEQYLVQDGTWKRFCQNAATLPQDDLSTFIRSRSGGRVDGRGTSFINSLGRMAEEVAGCR